MSILSNLKQLLHINDTDNDELLNLYIASAKEHFYLLTGRYIGNIINKTFVEYPETLGTSTISYYILPIAVNSIINIVIDGNTLDTNDYRLDKDSQIIYFEYDGYNTSITINKKLEITCSIGYTLENDYPEDLTNIITLIAFEYYMQLGNENYKTNTEIKINPEDIQLPSMLLDKIYLYKLNI